MKFATIASTGTVRVGKQSLRVVWTYAGVAFVEDAADFDDATVERRLKMRLAPGRVPKIIRDALVGAAKGRKEIDVPVDLSWASDYEQEVLAAAMRIPWGHTRPY